MRIKLDSSCLKSIDAFYTWMKKENKKYLLTNKFNYSLGQELTSPRIAQ